MPCLRKHYPRAGGAGSNELPDTALPDPMTRLGRPCPLSRATARCPCPVFSIPIRCSASPRAWFLRWRCSTSAIVPATNRPNSTITRVDREPERTISAVEPEHHQDAMFSLKFCTAIEWPAPIRTWPRCCSSAFIGTTKNPARRRSATISTHRERQLRRRRSWRSRRGPWRCRPGARGPSRAGETQRAASTAPDRDADGETPCSIVGLRQVEAERLRPIRGR